MIELGKFRKEILSNSAYHADTGSISRSALMAYLDSPRKYWAQYINPERPKRDITPAMAFGSAFHTLILEPEQFVQEYAVKPEAVLLKDVGREIYEGYKMGIAELSKSNKIILSRDDYNTLLLMEDALMNNQVARQLLEGGENESSFIWLDPHSELTVKARPDCINHGAVIDIKTIANASPKSFQRAMVDGGYHIQGAMCIEGIRQVTAQNILSVINICIEKTYPYSVGVYVIEDAAINAGHAKFKQTLMDMKNASVHNSYPDYPPQTVGLPAWAI